MGVCRGSQVPAWLPRLQDVWLAGWQGHQIEVLQGSLGASKCGLAKFASNADLWGTELQGGIVSVGVEGHQGVFGGGSALLGLVWVDSVWWGVGPGVLCVVCLSLVHTMCSGPSEVGEERQSKLTREAVGVPGRQPAQPAQPPSPTSPAGQPRQPETVTQRLGCVRS